MLYVFFLPLISVSLIKIFNKKTTFVSGFRIACVSYIVIIIDCILGFLSEIFYNLKTGIAFAVITINGINLILTVWFFALFAYGLSIKTDIKMLNSLYISFNALVKPIFIEAFIDIVMFKFLGIIFTWIFPLA